MHDITYPSMPDHGHYSVPILYREKTLGVLMVYIEAGHQYKDIELRFLDAVANIIAGLIHRRKAEEQVLTNINFLEELEKFNLIFQNGLIHDDVNRLNKEVLEALLETFGADRAWLLYPCDSSAETWSVPMECTRKEYPGAFEMGKEFPMTDEYRMIFDTCLNSTEAMVFGIQNDDGKPFDEFEVAKKFSIKAGVAISLRPPKGKPWLLGMHQCSYYRIWTNEERRLIKQIAERYAYVLNSIVLLNELQKSENQYRSLAETARDIIITCNTEGRFTYVNSIGLNFAGLTEAEAYQKTIFDYIAECNPLDIRRYFSDLIDGLPVNKLIELNLRSGNGTIIPFEINSSRILLENGKPGLTSVIRNITDRKHSEEQLVLQNSELMNINRELDQFVYSTSHDLRAPLTSVMGLINIALDSISDHEEVSDCLHMMETSIMRLDNVIKSIIGYSKNKRLSVVMEPINMKAIFDSIMEGISFLDDLKKVLVYSDIDTDVEFRSDKMRIQTILSNLINNAIKYRREIPDSYVKVVFRVVDNNGIISVEDNGEGVPLNKQQQIFDMFYRNSLAADGSGLGLYIVRQNIIIMNGTINLVSEEGRGSTFTVTIPMSATA
jgi:PAS domain S-box-containing protein